MTEHSSTWRSSVIQDEHGRPLLITSHFNFRCRHGWQATADRLTRSIDDLSRVGGRLSSGPPSLYLAASIFALCCNQRIFTLVKKCPGRRRMRSSSDPALHFRAERATDLGLRHEIVWGCLELMPNG